MLRTGSRGEACDINGLIVEVMKFLEADLGGQGFDGPAAARGSAPVRGDASSSAGDPESRLNAEDAMANGAGEPKRLTVETAAGRPGTVEVWVGTPARSDNPAMPCTSCVTNGSTCGSLRSAGVGPYPTVPGPPPVSTGQPLRLPARWPSRLRFRRDSGSPAGAMAPAHRGRPSRSRRSVETLPRRSASELITSTMSPLMSPLASAVPVRRMARSRLIIRRALPSSMMSPASQELRPLRSAGHDRAIPSACSRSASAG